MKRLRGLSRFLDLRLLIGVLAIGGHVLLGVQAWYGDHLAVVMLAFWASIWTVFALLNSREWRKTISRWGASLDAWQETNKLNQDFSSLLGEAADALAIWDREKAEDIVERANTISIMRSQNINERLNK